MSKTLQETRAWAVLREEIGDRAALALRDENRSDFKAAFLRRRIIAALSEAIAHSAEALSQ